MQSNETRLIKEALNYTLTLQQMDDFVTQELQDAISEMSYNIWKADKRGRSLEQVVYSVTKGVYAEFSVLLLLMAAGLKPEWNRIDTSVGYVPRNRFCFDILCLGKKIEVKTQPIEVKGVHKKFFSYRVKEEEENAYDKIKNFRDRWYDYDILVAVKTDYNYNAIDASFSPWMLIDNKIIDPSAKMFVYNSDTEYFFLKIDVCNRNGTMLYLDR